MRGPWWFSSGTSQRFDLDPPMGTCYLAEDPLGAFIEVFQDWMGAIVPAAEIEMRRLSTLSVPTAMVLADCTDQRGLAFGITAEIHSSVDRALTHAWAAAFAQTGFDGIRYLVRHDPAQQLDRRRSLRQHGRSRLAGGLHGLVSTPSLVTELAQRFGIRVL